MDEKQKAGELFLEGFNCAQAVFTAFSHRFGIDEDTAKRISAGLGGGVGRNREVCGAVSGAAMAIGSIKAATQGEDAKGKQENYELVREFCEKFKEIFGIEYKPTAVANYNKINNKNLNYETIRDSILMHFDLFIYVEKKITDEGEIKRKLIDMKMIKDGHLIDLIDEQTDDLNLKKLPNEFKEEFKVDV
jgi:C_GCAxxG_C_C family probable redox protein